MRIKLLLILLLFIIATAGYSLDLRAVKIGRFLDDYPYSPLRSHINEILYCADHFGLDYRLYLALSGAESSFGKKYPKYNFNLTGILNGSKKFKSIYDNIYETHKLIATGKWYKKYLKTKNIVDLVYVYKGVPPYKHYINNLRFFLDKIDSISVDDEKALLADKSAPGLKKTVNKHSRNEQLSDWGSLRYDLYEPGKKSVLNVKKALKEKRFGENTAPIGLPES